MVTFEQVNNSPELISAFWARIKKSDGCWEVPAISASHFYYPTIGINSLYERAHRLSYLINIGPIPEGMCVCHHCDNPRCARPDHLFLGTYADNTRDMLSKKRRNTHNGIRLKSLSKSGITATEIEFIRNSYRKYGHPNSIELALKHRTTPYLIRRIISIYGEFYHRMSWVKNLRRCIFIALLLVSSESNQD